MTKEGVGKWFNLLNKTAKDHSDSHKIGSNLDEAQKVGRFGEWEWDVATNRVIWSEGMYLIFGIEPGTEITVENSISAFHPDDREFLIDATKKVAESGIPQPIEARVLLPDGSIRYVRGSGKPIVDESGNLVKMIGYYLDITEEKLAFKRLDEVKQFYEALIDKAPDGVVLIDKNGEFSYISPSAKKLFGFYPEDDIHFHPNDYTHPDDLPMVLEVLGRVFANADYSPAIEYRFKNKTDEWQWVESTFTNLLQVDAVQGVVINFREITDRKATEHELKTREAQYRFLAESILDVIWVLDISSGEFTYVSPSVEKLRGYTVAEVMQQTYSQVLTKKSLNNFTKVMQARVKKYLETGVTDVFYDEIDQPCKDGSIVNTEVISYLRTNPDTGRIEAIGTSRDITGRKKAEDKFSKIFNSSPFAIAITKPTDGIIIDVNDAATKLIGYSHDEIVGHSSIELNVYVNPQDRADIVDALLKQGKAVKKDVRLRRKDGSQLIVSQTLDLMELNGEKLLLSLYEDITESLCLKEQLIASQKMDAIGQLAGGIAHDFNNLLTVILGYSEDLMLQLDEQSERYKAITEIHKAGRRAASLTRQLLTFSSKQVIQTKVLDINTIVSNMNSMLSRLIGEHIRIETHLATNLPYIKADPGHIEQVILNLVVNSRDAMPLGGIISIETAKIEVGAEMADLCPGRYVQLSVMDTGCGIAKDIQNKVFEPFFSTKSKDKGVGLGLSTVYGIVKQAKGHVYIESEADVGTKVRVLIPVSHDQELPGVNEELSRHIRGRGEMVLIVEDEESLCTYFSKMISSFGYQTAAYTDGLEAYNACEKGLVPDLILSDVVMPSINGKELVDKIREIHPSVRVIFMSGFTDNVVIHNEEKDERTLYIQKPFTALDIATIIYKQLSNGGGRNSVLSILMIDDEEDIRKLVGRTASKLGHKLYEAGDEEEALMVLKSSSVDMVIVDYNLIGISGVDVLTKLRDEGFHMPAIILTGAVNDDIITATENLHVVKVLEKNADFRSLMAEVESIFL